MAAAILASRPAAVRGGVLRGQACLVQPPVEGVEPGAATGAARREALGKQLEALSQGLENLSDNDVAGLRVFSGGYETCQARRRHPSTPSRLDPPPRVYLSA